MRNFIMGGVLLASTLSLSAEYGLLGGSETDTKGQSYSYAGFIGEKRIDERNSLMGKVWVDYLTYKFEQDGTEVKAKAPAAQLSLGLKHRFVKLSTTLWLGWERRDTDVNPDLTGVEVKGVKDSLLIQLEVDGWFNGTNASFITSYSSATSYLWARGRLKHTFFSPNTRLGVELIGHGNQDYRAVQSGAIGEYSYGRLTAGIHGGYKNSTTGNSLYVGVEVFVGF
ncbi:cellulose biosynthesis protein BcsS [Hydrogenivirga sp.]